MAPQVQASGKMLSVNAFAMGQSSPICGAVQTPSNTVNPHTKQQLDPLSHLAMINAHDTTNQPTNPD